MTAPRRRVLLVGWDAADWRVIHPLIDAGRMPTLGGIASGGAIGECASLVPSIAAMTWTSVVTGLRADRHGILSDREPDPVSGDWVPTSCRGRSAKALWNIATQRGLRSIVVNQAAAHPAEPILGVCVDERITSVAAPLGSDWPMPEGCVHPPGLAADLAELRLHPRELPAEELLPFIPGIHGIDTAKDPRPGLVADGLAATVSVHAVATDLLEREPWDFAAVRYHLLEPLSQVFMRWRPPLMDGISPEDAAAYGGVIDAGYVLLDAMLGRLAAIAGPDTIVILVSDHGFQSGAARPMGAVTSPLSWHTSAGIIAMTGHGVRADQLIHGASILDVAPTVLGLLGVPIGVDMPGRFLGEAFESMPTSGRVASWESEPGESGRHPQDVAEDPWQAHAAIREILALGYAETSPMEEATHAAAAARQELHRALALLEARDHRAAIPHLRRAIDTAPPSADHPRTVLLLAACLLAEGELEECRNLAGALVADPQLAAYAALLRGLIATSEGDTDDALRAFAEAETLGGRSAYLLGNVAWAHLAARRHEEAERVLRSMRDLEPDSALVSHGLSLVHAARGRHAESADEALDAVGRRYFWPEAHAQLGAALASLGLVDRAIQAFETSLGQRPSVAAHEGLAQIHERLTHDAARAIAHRRSALALRGQKGPIG